MSDNLKIGLLLRDAGPVEGRKKFQIIVYVLQQAGVDFEICYELSGDNEPYSPELKWSIDELLDARLIEERHQTTGERAYAATTTFISVLERAGPKQPTPWTDVARDLNGRDAKSLEGIGTVLILESHGWREAELGGRFRTLKPEL